MNYVLAIDQGTSGSKAIIFDENGDIISKSTVELSSHFFNDGFVEQKPEDIVTTVLQAVKNAVSDFVQKGHEKAEIIAAGISNQRESFLLWDKTGKPITQVVVWQCKRSIGICEQLKKDNLEQTIREKSGLMIDPYFSGTKVKWLMDNIEGLYEKSKSKNILFGNIDTWLLYNLTEGKEYKTDFTNASRTLFFNLSKLQWDTDLRKLLKAENLVLPELCPSSNSYGESTFGGVFEKPLPISSMIGDSHAAAFGEGCLSPGTVKATMGTGSSVLMNTGKRIYSKSGMVSTICWSTKDRTDYALEGVIVSCGSTITWMQNQLGLVKNGAEFDRLAESVPTSGNVTFLPAFSGLGGPHWQMERKAEITGITFGTTTAHIVRAALESYPFQLKDVIDAMEKDKGGKIKWLKADGGLTNSKLTMKYITQLLQSPVIIDDRKEASAFGAALLAFIEKGVLSLDKIDTLIKDGKHTLYTPEQFIDNNYILSNYDKWLKLVAHQ